MNSTSLLHWISRAGWNFSPLFLLSLEKGCGADKTTNPWRSLPRGEMPPALRGPQAHGSLLPAPRCRSPSRPLGSSGTFGAITPELGHAGSLMATRNAHACAHFSLAKRSTDPVLPNFWAPAALEGFSWSPRARHLSKMGASTCMLCSSFSFTSCFYFSTPVNDIPLKSNLLFHVRGGGIIRWKATVVYRRTRERKGLSFPK